MEDEMEGEIDQITETIYLGNVEAIIKEKRKLKKLGIKKILSVMPSFGTHFDSYEFKQKIIEVDDDYRANIIQYFQECILFIEGNDKIFIHCAAGMSRSPTIVIAYIMWKKRISLDEAIRFVREKRPAISPNANFMNQLKIFQDLLIKNDYDIDKINFKKIKVNNSDCILF